MKNIFNKNKIGKNDNIDIGHYKNNKIKGPKNSVINDLSIGNDVPELLKFKFKIENDIFNMKTLIWNCSECKKSYHTWMNKIKEGIDNYQKNNNEQKQWYNLYSKIENWEKVVTCEKHMTLGKNIEMRINQLKDWNYAIIELLHKNNK